MLNVAGGYGCACVGRLCGGIAGLGCMYEMPYWKDCSEGAMTRFECELRFVVLPHVIGDDMVGFVCGLGGIVEYNPG